MWTEQNFDSFRAEKNCFLFFSCHKEAAALWVDEMMALMQQVLNWAAQ